MRDEGEDALLAPAFSLDMMASNDQLCPASPLYGQELSTFFASPVYYFPKYTRMGGGNTGGKAWQLRTVSVMKNNSLHYHVLPFILSSGGHAWDVVFCTPSARKLIGPSPRRDDLLDTPLGQLQYCRYWQGHHAEWIMRSPPEQQASMNLLGHELAFAVFIAHFYANIMREQSRSSLSKDETHHFEREFGHLVAGASSDVMHFLQREVTSMLAVEPNKSWNAQDLPIPCGLFVREDVRTQCYHCCNGS